MTIHFQLERRVRAIRRVARNCRSVEEARLIGQLADFYERQVLALKHLSAMKDDQGKLLLN